MPCIVRNMDDEATIFMVDSNLQCESILPSEKAFMYKMKLEAMNRQGQQTDLTSVQSEQKLIRISSRKILAKQSGESGTQIFLNISLTELILYILVVDEKRIIFTPVLPDRK